MNNLLRVVYVSKSTTPINDIDRGVHKDIGRILMQSRKNNPKYQIGGVLYFSNNYFFQCLEGEKKAVISLLQKIAKDPRHMDVQTISVKYTNKRLFEDWSMKYVALQDNVTRLLNKNGMKSFNPYNFNDDMIKKMLKLFTNEVDTTSRSDQKYSENDSNKSTTGFFSRLFNKSKAA